MFVFSGATKYLLKIVICSLIVCAPGTGFHNRTADLLRRDVSIHWPEAFKPVTAPVFAHNELFIQASCHRVWSRLVDVTDWPNWFVLTKDVAIEGPGGVLQHGARIRLRIFGTPITSTIDEYVPESRLSWYPQGLDEPAPEHYHTWHLVPEGTGCRVVTEETGIGPNDIKAPDKNSKLVHDAHDLWLASLRWTSVSN